VIAVDTSTLIAFIGGQHGADVDQLDAALATSDVALPPVVLTEFLSEPQLPPNHRAIAMALPLLELLPDYWLRAGEVRAKLLAKGLRARLADSLIAQSCIDHSVMLITRDNDFRHFVKHGGLKLA
jgi:predicted nucleic acid-binding protein